MVLVLLAGLVALAAAPVVVVAATASSPRDRRRDAAEILAELGLGDGAAANRIRSHRMGSTTAALAQAGRRVVPAAKADALGALVVRSGVRLRLEEVLALKVGAGLAGTAFGLWVALSAPATGLALAGLCAALGFFGPDVLLTKRADARREAIRKALPDALDLLAISVEAGVGFEGALGSAAADLGGPLGEEFDRLLQEMRLGLSRREALVSLKERNSCRELSGFVLALLQADALGISVGSVLRTQANEMRSVRRRLAREQAAKTPVKLLFPLIFGIFPALLIIIIGPAMLNISESLGF